MHTLIIATSTNPGSRSQQLARHYAELLAASGDAHELVDLRDHPLPLSGPGGGKDGDPQLARLAAALEPATHLVIATPIYCYDVNAVAKQLIELLGRRMTGRVVGFICSAGGSHSYMAPMAYATQLMLDFRCVICPRFVYATKADWSADGRATPEITDRLHRLRGDLAAIQVAPGVLA